MLLNVADYEAKAKEKLGKKYYDFFSGGACDEISVENNQKAFDDIALLPKVCTGNQARDLTTSILGIKNKSPILVAPTAYHGLITPLAETASTRGAKAFDTIVVAATMSNSNLREIADTGHDKLWFQTFLFNKKKITETLIRRAEELGYKAIVLSVDTQIMGIRDRDRHNQFTIPSQYKLGNLIEFQNNLEDGELTIKSDSNTLFDKNLSWQDIEWICSLTSLPVLIKGILNPIDVDNALNAGAKGLIVSNHGGRQLDTTIPPILILPSIIEAVQGRVPVLVDGGIRRGTSVLKAIALGADAVLIGRPIIWGLTVDGNDGVEQVLSTLHTEFDAAMGMCGYHSINELKESGRSILSLNKYNRM